MEETPMRSERYVKLAHRPVNKETFINPWPEPGLILTGSPLDPSPSLKIENGIITEIDGKNNREFDLIDHFIAKHSINLNVAEQAMNTPSLHMRDVHKKIRKLANL